MGFTTDLRKIVLKNSVVRYLKYAELDDEVYNLILDKNLELLLEENKRLKEENMKLKLEGLLEEQPTIDVEINGKQMVLSKEELLQLVAKYKEKELVESQPKTIENNVFIPQEITSITTHAYEINKFYCHYQDDFGQKRSLISSGGLEKYDLYFDLFGLRLGSFYYNDDYFILENEKSERITISLKTTLTNEFLINFAKGKEFIRKA